MKIEQVRFKLPPLYKRWGIKFELAKVTEIHPEGSKSDDKPFVSIEYTSASKKGDKTVVEYDYLINATGPKLNFEATEGLSPGFFTHLVCSCDHAAET